MFLCVLFFGYLIAVLWRDGLARIVFFVFLLVLVGRFSMFFWLVSLDCVLFSWLSLESLSGWVGLGGFFFWRAYLCQTVCTCSVALKILERAFLVLTPFLGERRTSGILVYAPPARARGNAIHWMCT